MPTHEDEKTALCLPSGPDTPETTPPLWVSYIKLTRIHKFPAGSSLVFWPCSWGLILAAYSIKLPLESLCVRLFVYLIGSILRHNASCIWNDMCDREFDKKIERTKGRPLARGLVSMTGAAIFFAAHYLLCIILLSYAGDAAFKVGLFGLLFVDILYPLMKRWTDWPQAWLGVAMTWGLPVAWISSTGSMNWQLILPLYVGGVCWTLHYDSVYASQDRKVDEAAGVRSCAVYFGDNIRPVLVFFSTCFIFSLVLTGVTNGNGPTYFIITVCGAAAHFTWQLSTLDFDNDSQCWKMFQNNTYLGFLILTGMLSDYVLKVLV